MEKNEIESSVEFLEQSKVYSQKVLWDGLQNFPSLIVYGAFFTRQVPTAYGEWKHASVNDSVISDLSE